MAFAVVVYDHVSAHTSSMTTSSISVGIGGRIFCRALCSTDLILWNSGRKFLSTASPHLVVPQGRHRKSSLWAPRGSVSRHPLFSEWLPLLLSCLGRRHDCDGQPGIMGDIVNIAQVSNHLNLQTEENVIRWLKFPNVGENFIVHSHFIIMFY